MKRVLFVLLQVLCVSGMAATYTGNINQGNVEVSGSLLFSQQLSGNSKTNFFSVDGSGQYFLIDRLSVGASLSYEIETNTDDVGTLGPAGSYYFYASGPFAAYVSASYKFGLTDATVKGLLDGEVGVKYFITPSVAFGPYVDYRYRISRTSDNTSRLLVGANFGLYL